MCIYPVVINKCITHGKAVMEEIQQLNEVTLAVEKSTEMPPRSSALKFNIFPFYFYS